MLSLCLLSSPEFEEINWSRLCGVQLVICLCCLDLLDVEEGFFSVNVKLWSGLLPRPLWALGGFCISETWKCDFRSYKLIGHIQTIRNMQCVVPQPCLWCYILHALLIQAFPTLLICSTGVFLNNEKPVPKKTRVAHVAAAHADWNWNLAGWSHTLAVAKPPAAGDRETCKIKGAAVHTVRSIARQPALCR